MDVSTAKLLQEVVRRERLSLLSYVGDAFPWTARGRAAVLAQFRQIVVEHNRAVTVLGRLLERHRASPPFIGSFPSGFTAINFLGLDYIQSRVVEAERKSLSLLEAEVALVADAEVRAALEHFLAIKRDLLARLEALTSAPSTSAPTPAAS
jgi:hypothetical protein